MICRRDREGKPIQLGDDENVAISDKLSADWSWSRTVADETCSRKIFSQPAAESSLDWASKPAT